MPYEIEKSGDGFLLRKKDGGKILGHHDSRASAERQLAAIEANTHGKSNDMKSDNNLMAAHKLLLSAYQAIDRIKQQQGASLKPPFSTRLHNAWDELGTAASYAEYGSNYNVPKNAKTALNWLSSALRDLQALSNLAGIQAIANTARQAVRPLNMALASSGNETPGVLHTEKLKAQSYDFTHNAAALDAVIAKMRDMDSELLDFDRLSIDPQQSKIPAGQIWGKQEVARGKLEAALRLFQFIVRDDKPTVIRKLQQASQLVESAGQATNAYLAAMTRSGLYANKLSQIQSAARQLQSMSEALSGLANRIRGESREMNGTLSMNKKIQKPQKAVPALIRTKTAVYLSIDAVKALCPSCASEMASKNVKAVRLGRISTKMMAAIKDQLGTGDPGFFTRCMGHDFGRTFSDKEAFCAWLHKRVEGKWPGEQRSVDMEGKADSTKLNLAQLFQRNPVQQKLGNGSIQNPALIAKLRDKHKHDLELLYRENNWLTGDVKVALDAAQNAAEQAEAAMPGVALNNINQGLNSLRAILGNIWQKNLQDAHAIENLLAQGKSAKVVRNPFAVKQFNAAPVARQRAGAMQLEKDWRVAENAKLEELWNQNLVGLINLLRKMENSSLTPKYQPAINLALQLEKQAQQRYNANKTRIAEIGKEIGLLGKY